jgi:hypothetical protein
MNRDNLLKTLNTMVSNSFNGKKKVNSTGWKEKQISKEEGDK